MKTLAGRLGIASLLLAPAMIATAAESAQKPSWQVVQGGQTVRGELRAVPPAPPDAATDAPPVAVLESSGVFQAFGESVEESAAESSDGDAPQPRLFFRSGSDADEMMRETRERLADPEQRAKMQAEQRGTMQQQYPQIERALAIDEATREKLFDVLAEQQLQQMDLMYSRPFNDPDRFDSYKQAQAETQRLDALREVLGDEGLERYQNYRTTIGERMQVQSFSLKLPAGSKLQPDQEQRLIELYQEQNRRKYEAMSLSRPLQLGAFRGGKLPSKEEMEHQSLLATIAANEVSLASMHESNRELARQAAAFLTPEQVATLSKVNAEQEAHMQKWMESARRKAGLGPTDSASAAADANLPQESRKPIVGDMQVEISLVVNRGAPTVVTQTVRNGEVVTIETDEGLIVEATPTLYDDDWLDVKMAYYERGRTGKRLLQSGGSFGSLARLPNGLPHGGRSDSVVTGTKGYAVETTVNATPL